MRRVAPALAPLALVAAALLGVPPAVTPAVSPAATAAPAEQAQQAQQAQQADLTTLRERLAAATEQAERYAAALDEAAARQSALRVEMSRLGEQRDAAQDAVDARARQAYLATAAAVPEPMADLAAALAAPDLRRLADAELERRGARAAVLAASDLSTAVDARTSTAQALAQRADALRVALRAETVAALQAQEQARRVLAEAAAALEAERARARAAEVLRLAADLAAARERLDAASADVARSLTPAQTRRSRAAAEREAPLVALAEATGSGYPAGYGPSGTVLRGEASWYGPGFVGNPTASGAPYDPERLTCAHKTLPLGTLVRVSRAGLAMTCLVNDRGPYVDDRIIDLSRAGSRALGFDGVAQVVVEVLAPRA
ncbi:MAG TPA: septal ring lytic transglycosylase RlpA family protein [Mycobacteriales bacterium]|nr:septal ring lytic transglycosylase RlpA family protein [Mycobacteriales bacterium]